LEGIVAKRKRGVYKNNGLGWKKIKNPKYSQAEGRHDLFTRVKKAFDRLVPVCAAIPGSSIHSITRSIIS
jgi:hypothetical protein